MAGIALSGGVVTTPTSLTTEDLPALRKLAAFWDEREKHLARRGSLHRLIPNSVARLVTRIMVLYAHRILEAVERTGHLSSDERVDKDGRVSRL